MYDSVLDENLPPTPQLILEIESGNVRRSKARWRKILTWRAEHGIDDILRRPHTDFHVIKRFFPHTMLGQDRTGTKNVFYQRPGLLDWAALKAHGVTFNDMIIHYAMLHDWAKKKLCMLATTQSK